MTDLSGRVAVVTGASRGVGRGVAVELGTAGATVYVTGRSVADDRTENLPGTVDATAEAVTAAGGTGIAVRCDHTDDEDVRLLFERMTSEQGRLDLLVNNAWGGYEGYDESFDAPFWEQSTRRWDAMFDAGVRPAFTASRLAVPLLRRSERGLIVTVSAGDGPKYRGSLPYDVAKTAVERLGRAMAYELREAETAVTSLVVQPGFTRTERVEATFAEAGAAVPAETHSPAFVGRVVAALAGDPNVGARTGTVARVAELAREYDVVDVDGRRPEPFSLDTPAI
ncbi:SDR family NAD(P)-dependent oxidoreductase [Salinirubrum litoreum]|uniref:SDR family NAD(P)-dependent oxidoreductase n=1 Tax=Salinirubrum litoreum TaxID=1126234 RepID=A0ABD5R9C2_9EURY|nr:SDR family NAD(P)-dependent oxidoreductase [Salinirubrum litoreum]